MQMLETWLKYFLELNLFFFKSHKFISDLGKLKNQGVNFLE